MYRTKSYSFVIFIVLLLFIFACNKNEDDPKVYDHLISFNKIGSKTAVQSQSNLNALVATVPELSQLVAAATHNIDIYKIEYKTTYLGEEITASGLVTVPTTVGSYPIMSFQNGTNAKYSEAPTKNPFSILFNVLQSAASTGFITLLPDYLGFGSSEGIFHPYLHSDETVPAILDMIRATNEMIEELEVSSTNELFLMGYSQGGWATLHTMRVIEESYSTEFNLQATACGAGSYDMLYINDWMLNRETFAQPFYLPYIILSYQSVGIIDNELSDIFNAPYAAAIPALFNGSKDGAEINAFLSTNLTELLTDNYRNNFETDASFLSIKNALLMNSVEPWILDSPLKLYHGEEDVYVPFSVSEVTYNAFIDEGNSSDMIEFIPLPGEDHTSGVLPMGVNALIWFIDLKN